MKDLKQHIRFCTSPDEVRIAYTTIGKGPPLVRVSTYMTHLEYDWNSPVWHHWLRDLSQNYTFVRYDQRGCGLSDRKVADFSVDAWVGDLETVVDSLGLERFALLGPSQGAAIGVAYAIRHPHRISHLILYGGYIKGRFQRQPTPQQLEEANALLELMKAGWGKDNPAFRQVFSTLFMPEGTPEQIRWFNDLQQTSTSPENAARIEETVYNIDISDLAPRVTVPTLVLHARGD
ncbi:MAG: alpha/beta hydrolase, partial [candidate division Zixibacteria bacterium]|nr:alpha/beta hydrolase [candidate division Zixibacteria bacterium]NIW43270.1 alpha/beta fold hydrolase [Gammaproteobacteria bacterium]NIX54403.1 alpha/beta fold hydrolase [candidate division Zixibacteria bacterium]